MVASQRQIRSFGQLRWAFDTFHPFVVLLSTIKADTRIEAYARASIQFTRVVNSIRACVCTYSDTKVSVSRPNL